MSTPVRTFKKAHLYHAHQDSLRIRRTSELAATDVERLGDMLRYDVAFMSEQHPSLVAFPVFAVKGRGTMQGVPTFKRWISFGVKLDPVTNRDVINGTVTARFDPQSDEWVTYRHPKTDRDHDYTTLEKVTARSFFAEVSE